MDGQQRRAVTRTEIVEPSQAPDSRQERGRVSEPVAKPTPAVSGPPGESNISRTEKTIDNAPLATIKSLLFNQSKKFLSSCLEHLSSWHFENGEVHFIFGKKDSWVVDLLRSREQQETLRLACEQVLGQPVRIYAKIAEEEKAARTSPPQARERAERDSGVEALRKRFNCTLVDVQDLSQE